jgi:hypothetical protein
MNEITIFVKQRDEVVPFKMRIEESVETLKDTIRNEFGIPNDFQKLYFYGRQLRDQNSLHASSVSDRCVVMLLVREEYEEFVLK